MEEARDYIVKAVSVIQSHIFKWNEVTVRCRTILKELLSQVEQLECIRKSKPCLLTNAFPDLKERLQQMVQMTIDENLIALQIAWEDLSLANQKLKSTCDITQKAYLDNNREWENNPYFFYGSPLYPPISSALEWMEDVNIYYSNQLLVAKYSLEMFDYSSKSIGSFSEVFNSKHPPSWIEFLMLKMSYDLESDKINI